MESLNCRGLSCPQPVMETKKFLDDHPQVEEFSILLDNLAAAQNVERFLGSQGFSVSRQGSGCRIQGHGSKAGASGCTLPAPEANRIP